MLFLLSNITQPQIGELKVRETGSSSLTYTVKSCLTLFVVWKSPDSNLFLRWQWFLWLVLCLAKSAGDTIKL